MMTMSRFVCAACATAAVASLQVGAIALADTPVTPPVAAGDVSSVVAESSTCGKGCIDGLRVSVVEVSPGETTTVDSRQVDMVVVNGSGGSAWEKIAQSIVVMVSIMAIAMCGLFAFSRIVER